MVGPRYSAPGQQVPPAAASSGPRFNLTRKLRLQLRSAAPRPGLPVLTASGTGTQRYCQLPVVPRPLLPALGGPRRYSAVTQPAAPTRSPSRPAGRPGPAWGGLAAADSDLRVSPGLSDWESHGVPSVPCAQVVRFQVSLQTHTGSASHGHWHSVVVATSSRSRQLQVQAARVSFGGPPSRVVFKLQCIFKFKLTVVPG
jgi:hypothetical protein